MSYTPLRKGPSPSPSPDTALDDDEEEQLESPSSSSSSATHSSSVAMIERVGDEASLLVDADDADAIRKEARVERQHSIDVDEQLAEDAAVEPAASSPSPEASMEEGAAASAASSTPLPAAPAPSRAESEFVERVSEMTAEELKEHMADVADRVSRDVAEMEERKSGAAAPSAGHIVIAPGRHDKLIRTLFGFTLHCRCLINDEVRMTVWILLVVGVLCGVGFFVADVDTNSIDTSSLRLHERYVAILVGGIFAFLASLLSYIQIRAHHKNWVHPPSQRCVVRILLMVPVYSVSAWLSLVFLQWSLYIDFVRMCYEAFVIYTFMILLTKYLGGHNGVVEWMKTKPPLGWPSPMCCIRPVKPGDTFLYWLKYGTLQYTIISPIISILAMVLNFFGFYGDGDVNWGAGYVYITFIQNTTQLISLYCLVWLYVAMKNELAPFSPMAKFLVVKSVVFFTWWQSVGLAVLVKASILTSTAELDVGEIQVGLQDFIVCIEMFIAAAVHKYTFGWETYANGTMKLLMDQRAMYLAEMSYKRAQEEQKREEERLLQLERKRLGLVDTDEEDAVAADAEPLKKKRRRRRRKARKQADPEVEMESRKLTSDEQQDEQDEAVAIDISSSASAAAPALDPSLFSGDEDDDALVADEQLSQSQPRRPAVFTPTAASAARFSPSSATVIPSPSATAAASGSTPPHPYALSHTRRPSLSSSALDAVAVAGRGLIGSARSVLLPVSAFFVNDDDDALFDEEAAGHKPVMLTDEMRREIEERVRKEKEEHDRRKRERKSSAAAELTSSGGGGSSGGKRRSGDYQHISSDDRHEWAAQHAGGGVELQEREERKSSDASQPLGAGHDEDDAV